MADGEDNDFLMPEHIGDVVFPKTRDEIHAPHLMFANIVKLGVLTNELVNTLLASVKV